MFNYDWWHGAVRQRQMDEAKLRCTQRAFPKVDSLDVPADSEAGQYLAELEVHTVIYLRDGFSYEVGELIDAGSRSYLVCEVLPVEESWQSGAFIASLPFEEIVRVEVFAIHPVKKPRETPHITGFRTAPEGPPRE